MLAFPAGYANGQSWVGAPATGDGMFTMGPSPRSPPFHVPVTHVRISVSLNADGSVNGVFSGILPAVSLATAIERNTIPWLDIQDGRDGPFDYAKRDYRRRS